ncbi:hypothetical protein PYCCODRAFT_1430796 [Trametes coccinea BRFM310]|uniref:FCH-domain-containing protein n=1 Tax=Trametes coccinea (strain BRFM310) TaxID=1353009 RepID=A0A1Y2J518_TRAC3|nr:hypothetical protein PYCCODRAFT_1430796 [Trametes coccinea BRFM310]
MSVTGQTFGQHLPDQVEKISSLTDAQLELLADVRELHKERSALEREYAVKLQLLAKKAADKKAKKIVALVLGNEPTKAWDENTIAKSTLDKAYTQLIAAMTEASRDHVNLAEAIDVKVVEPLRAAEKRHEEVKKKEIQYYQKLLADRDRVYSDRTKSKQKYDEECAEVESYRQKQERSADDRHAERAARQYEQQQIDMLNSKNAYLISIAVANKVKEKFYSEDLPALENELQELQTRLLTRFVEIVKDAQELQLQHLDTLRSHLTATEATLDAVNPQADQDLFIDYNIAPFSPPPDWAFEPSAVHYDHGNMSVEPAPKVYLQNRLSKCRTKLQELEPVLSSKQKEADQLRKLVDTYTLNSTLGDPNEVLDNYLDARHESTFYATSGVVLTTESETIAAALQGDEGAQSPHTFKSSSFSIPTTCAYCKSSIWGLSKQGKTCKACGISVHSKCELKLPADCPGTRHGSRTHTPSGSLSDISRTSSTISRPECLGPSTSSGEVTPTPSSFARASHTSEEKGPTARVLFDFTPTSPFELAVSADSIVHVLVEDDGSGWVKVADESGAKGLVPASYVEFLDATPASSSSTASLSSGTQPTPGEYVRGLYSYKASGPDEIDVEEGKLIRLTDGPTGGRNYADGWWEGVDENGKTGIFPSNYVEPV